VKLDLSFKYERTKQASSNGSGQPADVNLVDAALEE
jgi:hypothetical protein